MDDVLLAEIRRKKQELQEKQVLVRTDTLHINDFYVRLDVWCLIAGSHEISYFYVFRINEKLVAQTLFYKSAHIGERQLNSL